MGFVGGGRPIVKWSSTTANVIVPGDSLPFGVGSTTGNDFVSQLAALYPFNGQVTFTNIGSPGATIENWITALGGTGYNVDAHYDASKKYNVILSWMGTNTIYGNSKTGLQAAALYAQFCAERLAVHPDYIIVPITMIARESAGPWGTADAANAELLSLDSEILKHHRAWGCKGRVWLRKPGSPFILPDFSTASFENVPYSNLEASGETGNRIHLNNTGQGDAAQIAANDLLYLAAR